MYVIGAEIHHKHVDDVYATKTEPAIRQTIAAYSGVDAVYLLLRISGHLQRHQSLHAGLSTLLGLHVDWH